jgi:hypothetical protein
MASQAGKPMKRVRMADGSEVLLPVDAIVEQPAPSDPAEAAAWLARQMKGTLGGAY